MFCNGAKQFLERRRAQENLAGKAVSRRFQFRFRGLELRIKHIRSVTLRQSISGRIADGAVTGATTQIAAELFVELRRGLEVLPIISFEERHDETRRAIAALRSEILDHRFLDRMHFRTRDAFDRNDLAAGHERQRDETTVDGAVTTPAARVTIDDRDRARAAIAFRATFLRTGQ